MAEAVQSGPVFAVFASDRGPGDPERSSIMSQAGSYFARLGARIVCLAENGAVPVPLITAARTAGGYVQVIGDAETLLPSALADVPLETLGSAEERLARLAALADILIALPGSLASTTALFGTWSAAKASQRRMPVLMLNRHKAFEVVRGFAGDVLSHGMSGHDKAVQFSDSIEDMWSRATRLVGR
jgi:predicted Rossmann-fold nucleotide-binding protein